MNARQPTRPFAVQCAFDLINHQIVKNHLLGSFSHALGIKCFTVEYALPKELQFTQSKFISVVWITKVDVTSQLDRERVAGGVEPHMLASLHGLHAASVNVAVEGRFLTVESHLMLPLDEPRCLRSLGTR